MKKSLDYRVKRAILGVFKKDVRKNFRQEEDPHEKKWAPWSPGYKNRTGKKLHDTGRLKSRFRYKIKSNRLEITNKTRYARYHQEGTDRLPQRQMVGLSDKVLDEIKDEVSEEIVKEILKLSK